MTTSLDERLVQFKLETYVSKDRPEVPVYLDQQFVILVSFHELTEQEIRSLRGMVSSLTRTHLRGKGPKE